MVSWCRSMTSTDKRLDAATAELTVRERLRLVMRAWLNGEPWDERLVRHVPPERREEYERLSSVVEDANLNLLRSWPSNWSGSASWNLKRAASSHSSPAGLDQTSGGGARGAR